MDGTAMEFYKAGISASFKTNSVTGEAEYLNGTIMQIPYADAKNTANNAHVITNITVKWNEAGNCCKQSWIAPYPEETEARPEFRHTGYLKLYPVAISKNPDLPAGTFI